MGISMNLSEAIESLPAGRYAVAVSGGADSVALLHILHGRPDLELHVCHLDHETREGESTRDAEFVSQLCVSLGVPCHSRRRSTLEPHLPDLPANRQARFRMIRLALFREVMAGYGLSAVLQGHHADDQAETVFMRLARGTGIDGITGIAGDSTVSGVRILRPLLGVRRQVLRDYLQSRQLPWREDSSNATTHYRRNQVRMLLASRPKLVEALLEVAGRFSDLGRYLESNAPRLEDVIPIAAMRDVPPLLLLHALRRWLLDRGVPADDMSLTLLDRVCEMVQDNAAPHAMNVPGGMEIRRKAGQLSIRRLPTASH